MRNLLRLSIIAPMAWLGAIQLSSDCAAQCTTNPLDPGIIVVDSASQAQNPDGRSWPCAFPTVQAALTVAAQSQGSVTEIWVAAGTYTPSAQHDPNHDDIDPCCGDPNFTCCTNGCDDPARTKTFQLIAEVSMYGGFLGNAPGGGETNKLQADPFTNLTILSGDLLGNDDPQTPSTLNDNAYHVLYYYLEYDGQSQLPDFESWEIDGFVIEGGNADGGSQEIRCANYQKLNAFGGGMLNNVYLYGRLGTVTEPACPRIRRCVFRNNRSTSAGGGYACIDAGGYFENCEFRDNLQTTEVADIVFHGGVQPGGAGVSALGPLRLLKSKFINNSAKYGNGALSSAAHTSRCVFIVADCEFLDNDPPSAATTVDPQSAASACAAAR